MSTAAKLSGQRFFNLCCLFTMFHYSVCDKLRFCIYICCFIAGFAYRASLVSKRVYYCTVDMDSLMVLNFRFQNFNFWRHFLCPLQPLIPWIHNKYVGDELDRLGSRDIVVHVTHLIPEVQFSVGVNESTVVEIMGPKHSGVKSLIFQGYVRDHSIHQTPFLIGGPIFYLWQSTWYLRLSPTAKIKGSQNRGFYSTLPQVSLPWTT